MRTDNQIKRKLNELLISRQSIAARYTGLTETNPDNVEQAKALQSQLDRLDESISLLQWVLDEPTGTYHA
ncbi:hypothetical protein [Paenibacillus xerothermodurans]|uniref:Uncharacterized protein n=1 Tax=Paenibacillus xerothermodurans TaxID=1977292 RepID=A0A2W1NQL8_PAEXE|nr:hypothetical protein [Paenibacillus xerothermodurans]PZE21775.1 hypothetical protein CBW46_005010 [Paenibacillus xerothermodurans]